jgi:hypothetical protein
MCKNLTVLGLTLSFTLAFAACGVTGGHDKDTGSTANSGGSGGRGGAGGSGGSGSSTSDQDQGQTQGQSQTGGDTTVIVIVQNGDDSDGGTSNPTPTDDGGTPAADTTPPPADMTPSSPSPSGPVAPFRITADGLGVEYYGGYASNASCIDVKGDCAGLGWTDSSVEYVYTDRNVDGYWGIHRPNLSSMVENQACQMTYRNLAFCPTGHTQGVSQPYNSAQASYAQYGNPCLLLAMSPAARKALYSPGYDAATNSCIGTWTGVDGRFMKQGGKLVAAGNLENFSRSSAGCQQLLAECAQ